MADWLQYSNQGATRSLPLSDKLVGALGFLPELGVTMNVVSGGQAALGSGGPRTGSTRHDHGDAADADFYKDGRKLDWNNPDDIPLLQEIVRKAKARGITGIGAGDDYMGAGRMHIGFGGASVWGAGGKGENAPEWLREAYHSVGDGHDHGSDMVAGGSGADTLSGDDAQDRIDLTPEQSQRIYDAYTSGKMTDQQKSEYEADIAAGVLTAPEGYTPITPTEMIQVEPAQVQSIYDAYYNGNMSPQQRLEYEQDVAAGIMPSPVTPDAMRSLVYSRENALPQGYELPAPSVAKPEVPRDPNAMLKEGAKPGYELAGRASAGVIGTGPSVAAQMLPEGTPAREAVGRVLDAPLAGLGVIASGVGGVVGKIGDTGVDLGMSENSAGRLTRDINGIFEYLAGSPNLAARAPVAAAQRTARVSQADVAAPALADAERAGVRVLTSDIRPPETFAARSMQTIGERIPIAGTGPVRAAQVKERVAAVENVVREFADPNIPIDTVLANVTSDLLAQRSARLEKYATAKKDVINRLASSGEVDVTQTIAAIDNQIADLSATRLAEFQPVIARLENWKGAIQGQDIKTIESIRKQMGESFAGVEQGSVRSAADNALSGIYGPLRDDMGNFIRANGERRDVTQWMVANRRLSEDIQELGVTSLGGVLKSGDETPENVRRLLFSQKTSDVARLYRDLSPQGQSNARAAVMLEALDKSGGIDNISAAKFVTQVGKMGRQVGVTFKGQDREVVEGLINTLKLTQQADRAGLAPPTGVQNYFATALGGASLFNATLAKTAAAAGSVGLAARAYESAPMRNILLRMSRVKSGTKAEKDLLAEFYAAASKAETAQAAAITSQNATQGAAQ